MLVSHTGVTGSIPVLATVICQVAGKVMAPLSTKAKRSVRFWHRLLNLICRCSITGIVPLSFKQENAGSNPVGDTQHEERGERALSLRGSVSQVASVTALDSRLCWQGKPCKT